MATHKSNEPKEDKAVAAARKDAAAKVDGANDAAQDAAKAQTKAADAAEAATTARFEAEAAKAAVEKAAMEKNAAAAVAQPVAAVLPPTDYFEFTVMHTMMELPNGDIKRYGDQVTTKDLRGTGTKEEQDTREKRYIEAGAVAKTGEVKFRPG